MDEQAKPVLYNPQNAQKQPASTPGANNQLEPVVSAPGTIKKKTRRERLKEEFISEDASKVKSYLWEAVIKPSFRDTIWNLITKGLKMFLYKNGEAPTASIYESQAPRINYAGYYGQAQQPAYPLNRTSYNYGEVILRNRGEAEEVIRRLYDIVRQVGIASIGDLYQLCNMPTQFPDFTYGWTDLSDARIVDLGDGRYLISLPRPNPIR